jgi:hypothetical protein
MRAKRRNTREEVKKRSRATKEQADTEGIGTPADGIRLSVPSYTEDDQTSFLGVDEPVVDPDERGTPPPAPVLPSTQDT